MKTEVGMTAAQELIVRHRVRRILVVCSPALQIQRKEQMREKFGLDFRIVDSNLMKELRRSRGIHVERIRLLLSAWPYGSCILAV
jgi:hypothetical protein